MKVIMLFIIIFIASCGLLAFKINNKEICTVKEFKIEAPSFKAGELITFSDITPNAYEWRWYFGDASKISYRSKVVHSFAKPGKYTVKLLVNNNCTIEKTITIVEKKEVIDKSLLPKLYAPTVVYQGETVSFKDSTAHAKNWEWRFGDGNKIDAIEQNPTHVYRIPGKKIVSLVVNGNIKYVQYAEITVLPSKKEEKDIVTARLERRGNSRIDPVKDYFANLPEVPTRSAEISGINEELFKSLLLGICEDKLSYENVLRYFCEDAIPLVKLRNGKTISLKSLDEAIRDRNINIKKVELVRDKDGCVTIINLNYRYKTIF